jgi:hypothetical protein
MSASFHAIAASLAVWNNFEDGGVYTSTVVPMGLNAGP